MYDEMLGITLQEIRERINEQQYLQQIEVPQRKLIALLGLIEESNELIQEVFNNLDIFATNNKAYNLVEELQSVIEISIGIGKELGNYKKRLLKEDLGINVKLKNNEWYDINAVTEEGFDTLYYWLLLLSTDDIDLMQLYTFGLDKMKKKDGSIKT